MRRLLAVLIVAVAVAGCTSQTPTAASEARTIVDTTSEVRDGFYKYWEFEVNGSARLNYTVRVPSGEPVDIFLAERSHFERYEDQSTFQYLGDGSALGTASASRTVSLESGRYVLFIDNTDTATAKPPTNDTTDSVRVRIAADLTS